MNWDDQSIKNHIAAAKKLDEILQLTLDFLRGTIGDVTEYEASRFIETQYLENDMVSALNPPIVAFRESTSQVHYFPEPDEAKVLERDSLILIDIWAGLKMDNAPFADITWMAYFGEGVPADIQDRFDLVLLARDEAVRYLEETVKYGRMPTGRDIDNVVRSVFEKVGQLSHFQHTTGHSIGFNSPHGELPGINQRNNNKLLKNVVYTIEPGLYYPGGFGIRSEIDFYVNNENKVVVTTPVQKEITKI